MAAAGTSTQESLLALPPHAIELLLALDKLQVGGSAALYQYSDAVQHALRAACSTEFSMT